MSSSVIRLVLLVAVPSSGPEIAPQAGCVAAHHKHPGGTRNSWCLSLMNSRRRVFSESVHVVCSGRLVFGFSTADAGSKQMPMLAIGGKSNQGRWMDASLGIYDGRTGGWDGWMWGSNQRTSESDGTSKRRGPLFENVFGFGPKDTCLRGAEAQDPSELLCNLIRAEFCGQRQLYWAKLYPLISIVSPSTSRYQWK